MIFSVTICEQVDILFFAATKQSNRKVGGLNLCDLPYNSLECCECGINGSTFIFILKKCKTTKYKSFQFQTFENYVPVVMNWLGKSLIIFMDCRVSYIKNMTRIIGYN